MVLKLNGKPFSLHTEAPTTITVRKTLDKAPPDELFTTQELLKRAGVGRSSLVRGSGFDTYRLKVGPKVYWGHPKAIAELKKQVAREG